MRDWYEVADNPQETYAQLERAKNEIQELKENNAFLMDQLADNETTICMLLESELDYDDDHGEGY